MGVDYRAVLYVGKYFDTREEAEEFISDHFELYEEDLEVIEEDGLEEWAHSRTDIDIESLDCYTCDTPYAVGYSLSADADTFKQQVDDGISKWKKLFYDVPYEIIHTVAFS